METRTGLRFEGRKLGQAGEAQPSKRGGAGNGGEDALSRRKWPLSCKVHSRHEAEGNTIGKGQAKVRLPTGNHLELVF